MSSMGTASSARGSSWDASSTIHRRSDAAMGCASSALIAFPREWLSAIAPRPARWVASMNIDGSDTTRRASNHGHQPRIFRLVVADPFLELRLGTAPVAQGSQSRRERRQEPEDPDVALGCEPEDQPDPLGIGRVNEESARMQALLDIRRQLAAIPGVKTRDVGTIVDGPVPPEEPVDVMECVDVPVERGEQVRSDLQAGAERREQAPREGRRGGLGASADPSEFQAFAGSQDGRPVLGIEVGAPHQHGLLGVDDDRGRVCSGIEGASEHEISHQGRAPRGRQVHGPETRLRLDQRWEDSVLRQTVAHAEEVAGWSLRSCSLSAISPAQADRIREIEPVPSECALDRDHQPDHPDQAPGDRVSTTTALGVDGRARVTDFVDACARTPRIGSDRVRRGGD